MKILEVSKDLYDKAKQFTGYKVIVNKYWIAGQWRIYSDD